MLPRMIRDILWHFIYLLLHLAIICRSLVCRNTTSSKLTEPKDEMAMGCAFNHAVLDGISTWHFVIPWAKACSGSPGSTAPPFLDRIQGQLRQTGPDGVNGVEQPRRRGGLALPGEERRPGHRRGDIVGGQCCGEVGDGQIILDGLLG